MPLMLKLNVGLVRAGSPKDSFATLALPMSTRKPPATKSISSISILSGPLHRWATPKRAYDSPGVYGGRTQGGRNRSYRGRNTESRGDRSAVAG